LIVRSKDKFRKWNNKTYYRKDEKVRHLRSKYYAARENKSEDPVKTDAWILLDEF